MRTSRFHVFLAFIAIMLLRVTVGFHFFKEGTDKIQNGFTAEYFLKAAKGPLAPQFHALVDDYDGALKFGLTVDSETGQKNIDPELTFALWDDFLDRADSHYGFGDEKVLTQMSERRERLGQQIRDARSSNREEVETGELERIREQIAQDIATVRNQQEQSEVILQDHMDELDYWLNSNRVELLAFFETADREQGFDRDRESRDKVAVYVDSLRDQVTTIKSDRNKQKSGWASEVEAIWDSYENQINGLAVGSQTKKQPLKVHRPFAQELSKLQLINKIIPWFDLIVGALLIVGLFTRMASFAGAVFLASVIATQPPWIPGTEPTYLYAIELMALVVIFSTLAGRMGGLDFFLAGRNPPDPA